MPSRIAGIATLLLAPVCLAANLHAQALPHPGVVLVELFTSEGCSDCPPADALLRQMTGKKTPQGQLIIGISEHVTYWNHLGWTDAFSAEAFTERQADYERHLSVDGPYTPQIVVNGREQFVGGNHTALSAAFNAEAALHQISLTILSAQLAEKSVNVTWSASDLPLKVSLRLLAILVDDSDSSTVLKGENHGKELAHAWVARSITPIGKLTAGSGQSATLPLPPSFDPAKPHHLVLIAQQGSAGVVLGADGIALHSDPAPISSPVNR